MAKDGPANIKLGYARVSTSDQDMAMQRNALIAAGVDARDIWEEKKSGATLAKRKEFQKMLVNVQRGDTVVVWKLDRLGRNALDLYNVAKLIDDKGATLEVITQPGLNTSTPMGRAMFGMLAVFAEFERAIAHERTMAGLAQARSEGRAGGRISAFTDEEVLATHGMRPTAAIKRLLKGKPKKVTLTLGGYKKRLDKALANQAETAVAGKESGK